jgi:hypothetical protein
MRAAHGLLYLLARYRLGLEAKVPFLPSYLGNSLKTEVPAGVAPTGTFRMDSVYKD